MTGAEGISSYIYIYHLGLIFNIPTLPESLTETMNITYNATPILGRSAPLQTFTGAGPRSVNIDIKLHRQLFQIENPLIRTESGEAQLESATVTMSNPTTGNIEEVDTKDAVDYLVDALTSISLPKYTSANKAIVPPSVFVRYGNELAMRGVPSQVTKTSSGVWLKNGKMAMVEISFNLTEVEPYSAQYAAANGSLRGVPTGDTLAEISTDLARSSVWQSS